MRTTYVVLVLTMLSAASSYGFDIGATAGIQSNYSPCLSLCAASKEFGKSGFSGELALGAWYDWQHPYYLTASEYTYPTWDSKDKVGLHSSARILYSGESGARRHGYIAWITLGAGAGYETRADGMGDIVDTWTFSPATVQLARFSVRTGVTQELNTEISFRQAWDKPPYFLRRASSYMSLGVGYRFSVWGER